MALSTGTRLGPYEILAPIGAGGMGEVYRAKDTKLKREVALKVLPDAFANDPDRMLRFEREAEVLAALNHPHIAQIYGVEERALVMELVEGDCLRGPLPLDTALNYARQIAEALEAAHEKGIIHRDLKPANVMITPEGVVKVLDFGLAAMAQAPSANSANSPTLTMSPTMAGVIIGTAGYMSPEQAAGKPIDRRSDIWSFGVVVWEMVTGQALFHGETVSHTLADVLRAEIDFTKLPRETPAAIRYLLRRCLDRNVKNRLRDIGEARIAIDNSGKALEAPAAQVKQPTLSWAVAAVFAIAALALAFVHYRGPSEEPHTLKLSLLFPEKASYAQNNIPTVSPDGRRLVFATTLDGKTALWVRDFDSLASRPLSGTDGARYPFWSPDSRFIGFFAGGKMKKISVAGGPALSLCDATSGLGGSWSKNDVIVFTPDAASGLFRVPAGGGSATAATALDWAQGETCPWRIPKLKQNQAFGRALVPCQDARSGLPFRSFDRHPRPANPAGRPSFSRG